MQYFDYKDWTSATKTTVFTCGRKQQVNLRVVAPGGCLVLGVRDVEEIPLATGTELHLKGIFRGWDLIKLVPMSKAALGYKATFLERQEADQHDPTVKAPVAPLPGPNTNLLLQMRHMMREELKGQATPVMEPENLPTIASYELSDDEDATFEEEILSSQAEIQKLQTAEPQDEEQTPTPPAPEAQSQQPGETPENTG
jgi:hypothetical protein